MSKQNLAVEEDQSEKIDIDLKDLYANNGTHTPEEKVGAVMAYMVTGTSRKASKVCGIPEGTIRWWKSKALWWADTMAECRKKKQDELDAMCTDILHETMGQLQTRVREGDTKHTKEGTPYSAPLSARDLAVTFAIIFDKRQLLRGDVTQRTERISERERLDSLQKKFEEMARKSAGGEITINGVEYNELDEDLKDVGESE